MKKIIPILILLLIATGCAKSKHTQAFYTPDLVNYIKRPNETIMTYHINYGDTAVTEFENTKMLVSIENHKIGVLVKITMLKK